MNKGPKQEPQSVAMTRPRVEFHQLMRHHIRDILLVSSMYDAFLLSEEGGLYEMLLNEYTGLNLSRAPGITRVASGNEALAMADQSRYDLILVTAHIVDMSPLEFARKLRDRGIEIPLVFLAFENHQLEQFSGRDQRAAFDKVFLWQGNIRILLAIIKSIEDARNVADDTALAGVQSVILIEDDVKFYSSYLPIVFTELVRHVQEVMEQGVNVTHKVLLTRARPKILLCHTYEEAWSYFEQYHQSVLGVISDVRFPHKGEHDPEAGITFARRVKESHEDISVLLQSNDSSHAETARALGAEFLLKGSPRLLHDLRRFMRKHLSFGDFIFTLPDGTEVGRAHDLRKLEELIATIPDESLIYHAERNHFSNWLKARTEFDLAHRLRPQKVAQFATPEELRETLITALRQHYAARRRGVIVEFDPQTFDGTDTFSRIGEGSLGGKGRGLVFIERLLGASSLQEKYHDINISVPPAVFVRTDIFDEFMDENNLSGIALESHDDALIRRRFIDAAMPPEAARQLKEMLRQCTYPLAVRSSSILEDSLYQPFAGVYDTYMVPNNHRDIDIRLQELLNAIKCVYASTFTQHAKNYIRNTPYRLEEEKMAVIVQKMVGQVHGSYFYPDFAGVAQSHNFYPIDQMQAEDGLVAVALGLGAMVVEGGYAVRFCPKYPRHSGRFASVREALSNSQQEFFALEMPDGDRPFDPYQDHTLARLGLDEAERHNVLGPMGSVCSMENNAVYDGLSRKGARIVTFNPILKGNGFPLAEVLSDFLELCRTGMGTSVEIEFSGNMTVPPDQQRQFQILQLRPMVLSHEKQELRIKVESPSDLVCASSQVMGNGIIRDIHDVVVVDRDRFDRASTREMAQEIRLFNLELLEQKRPYLLIGIGRWGSADPWLGIPVAWDEIDGARAIVETGFDDMSVVASQGSHFFQNLHSYGVGYFTVAADKNSDFLDWEWLLGQSAQSEKRFTRRLQFDDPLVIKMSGHDSKGVIFKPSRG